MNWTHFHSASRSTRDLSRCVLADVVGNAQTARVLQLCSNLEGPRVPAAGSSRGSAVRECHSKQHLRHPQRTHRKVSVQLQYFGDQPAPKL